MQEEKIGQKSVREEKLWEREKRVSGREGNKGGVSRQSIEKGVDNARKGGPSSAPGTHLSSRVEDRPKVRGNEAVGNDIAVVVEWKF